MRIVLALIVSLLTLSACQAERPNATAPEPVFHTDGNPEKLSDWGQIISNGQTLKLAERALVYDLNSALFSDYALKLRTVYVPEGKTANYNTDDTFDFPVGTVITKTFYYPRGRTPGVVLKPESDPEIKGQSLDIADYQLLETRILARREEGWIALPYVWNERQTDASLKRIGDIIRLTLDDAEDQADFAYVVPNVNQCAGCHATNNTTRQIEPIGPKARHLNKNFDYDTGTENQLAHWVDQGLLSGITDPHSAANAAVWNNPSAPLSDRARAYLDINCAHCHNEVGPADTSGLHLESDTPIGPELGLCKPPIAAGTGTGGRLFGIVPGNPEASIFVYRTASTDPAVMMPELGRALSHKEGVALLNAWITDMDGGCG